MNMTKLINMGVLISQCWLNGLVNFLSLSLSLNIGLSAAKIAHIGGVGVGLTSSALLNGLCL